MIITRINYFRHILNMKNKTNKNINKYHCDHIDVKIVSIAKWNFKYARRQFSRRLWIILQWTGTRFRRRASVLSSNSKPLWGALISPRYNAVATFHKSNCRPIQTISQHKDADRSCACKDESRDIANGVWNFGLPWRNDRLSRGSSVLSISHDVGATGVRETRSESTAWHISQYNEGILQIVISLSVD